MKEFAKMLMVLETNIKAIRPCTEALTYLFIELRLNGPVNNISVMLRLLKETGRDLKGQITSKFAASQANHALSLRLRLRFISILYQWCRDIVSDFI